MNKLEVNIGEISIIVEFEMSEMDLVNKLLNAVEVLNNESKD